MNRWEVDGSVNNFYRYHIWLAPSAAPVIDSSGMARGHSDPQRPSGGAP